MNALARTFAAIFGPPWWQCLPLEDQFKLPCAVPLLHRLDSLGRGWHNEEDVCGGNVNMSIIGARCFWAKDLGLIEYRRRFGRSGVWIRLTPKGLRYLRESGE